MTDAAFVKRLEADGIKLDEPPRQATSDSNKITYITDPWGTRIEIIGGRRSAPMGEHPPWPALAPVTQADKAGATSVSTTLHGRRRLCLTAPGSAAATAAPHSAALARGIGMRRELLGTEPTPATSVAGIRAARRR